MKPTKVFHFIDFEKESFYFNNLVDFTDRNEFEYAFLTFAAEGTFTESMKRRGCHVYFLNALEKSRLPKAAYRLWQIMKKENPSIVHTHLFNPTAVALTFAKWQKRKTVLTRHHSDALHLLASKPRREIYLTIDRRNNRLADHIIAPSRMVRDCVVEWEGTPAEKVSVIPYGQTTERFDAVTSEIVGKTRAELGMNEQLSLVCISRLFNRKGHIYLFEAVAPLVKEGLKVKIYLAGTGDYEKTLRAQAEELGILENIVFLGWRADVLAIIGAADIIVHPSLEDALSQSLIESLMLKRPIIATDISGAADTLHDGDYGKLVPPADSAAFKKALEEIIADLPQARERAEKGREYILDYMNASRTTDEYLAIYRKLLR